MKNFLIPIYVKSSNIADEKVLVAILLSTPQKVWFHFSKSKIALASNVFNGKTAFLAKEALIHIQNKVKEVNEILEKPINTIFKEDHNFTPAYFEQLHQMSQNTLFFGDINPIVSNQPEESFKSICFNLLNERVETQKIIKPSFRDTITMQLHQAQISDKVDIDIKIKSTQIKGIYHDSPIGLIAQSDCIIATEIIDFRRNIGTVANALNTYEILISALNQYSKSKKLDKGEFSIIASTPVKGSKNEKLLKEVMKQKKEIFNIILEDELHFITDRIKDGDYQKFSKILTKDRTQKTDEEKKQEPDMFG